MYYLTFGEWVREARESKKLTLRAFAAQVGVTPSYISDIENDRRRPAEDFALKMAFMLGLDAADFLCRAGILGKDAEKYLRSHPDAIALIRYCYQRNLANDELAALCNDVDRLVATGRIPPALHVPCPECGQVDQGQTGERLCTLCGMATVHDVAVTP